MTYVRSFLLPVVAVVLVVLASLFAPSGPGSPRPPSAVAVTQSSYACPAGSVITVAAGQVKAGTGATTRVLPGDKPDDELGDASAWRTSVVDGQGVVVQQEGRASGAVGYFAGTAPKSGGGGLVVGPCSGIVDDAWLLGLGSGDRHFSTVILTNLADSPAVVDLTLWGPSGTIDADTDGIVVPPSSVRRIRLDSLAAGEAELAVRVTRRRGSVSVVANDTSTATFKGTEPVSSTLSPRRSQVVGGIVKGAGGRTLLLLNPGDSTARVDVDVIGAKNTFTPSGLGQVKVGPGSLRTVTVPKSAGGDEQALRVTSDEPVAATVRLSPGTKDYAYAEASAPLAGPAVVPLDLGVDLDTPRLVLSAPRGAASAQVEAFDQDMKSLGTTSVQVKAGTTRSTPLKTAGAAYVVVRPRGEVVGAVTYAKGDGVSSLLLTPAPVSVPGPQVRQVN